MKIKGMSFLAGLCLIVMCFNGGIVKASDITAAALGDIFNLNDVTGGHVSEGDTFINTWGANDTFYMMHDDGKGFGSTNYNDQLDSMAGDPNYSTGGVQGTDLNPGSLSLNMPQAYSEALYEVDGVLYQGKHFSGQNNGNYNTVVFYNSSLMKSTDGGTNWYNPAGQLNTLPPNNLAQSTFPSLTWGFPNFINYGKGGTTPNVDNANSYVYLIDYDTSATVTNNPLTGLYGDNVYLARIPRSSLANLNASDVQYYVSGDGTQNSAWTTTVGNQQPIVTDAANIHLPMINYDYSLQRYVMENMTEFFPNGGTTGQLYRTAVYTALHPWGPWTKLVSYAYPHIFGTYMANNKWTSNDGKKMWLLATGAYNGDYYPYGVLYQPLYLSDGTVDTYQAENGTLLGGANSASTYPSYSGTGYVNNLSSVGDGVRFTVNNINGTGWHIVNIHYASTIASGNPVSVYVNGTKAKFINKLSYNDSSYKSSHNWTDNSQIYYLNNGTNTFDIKLDSGDTGTGLLIDKISVSENATYDEGVNVAPNATVTASSTYSGYSANAVKDGVVEGYPNNTAYEWASNGEVTGDWVQLSWSSPVTISKVVLYDRPNTMDQVTSGTLTFSDGTSVSVGKLQDDAQSGTIMTFPAKTVTWAKFTINGAKFGSPNTGLSEFQAFSSSSNKVDDSSGNANITYSGTWPTTSSASYSDSTAHYCNTSAGGDYAQYSFVGPDITWIGARNTDHGKADIYIDGALASTVDTYGPLQFQTANYVKTGLSNGSHTIKVVLESSANKNPSSSNNYTDVDAFCTGCGSKTDDADGGITYSSWSSSVQAQAFNGGIHYTGTSGAYAQYSFYGTNITWMGSIGSDHGKADVYIDGTLDSTLDLYASATEYQSNLYIKSGLSKGEHTIKIVERSDHNPSSSNYWIDMDTFMFSN